MTATILKDKTNTDRLKVADRCDYCEAQAFVIARFANGELHFCGHHFAHNEIHILTQAYEVIDARHLINVKASQSSA